MITRFLWNLCRLRQNLQLDASSLQKMQQKKLRAIIKHAYENVPFYHRKFDKAGIKPDDVKSVADLAKVPMTIKSEVQASSLEDIVARGVDVNRCVKNTTSGSTGVPLTTFIDDRTLDFDRGVWIRAFLENGLRLRDKRVIITDPRNIPTNRGWTQHLGIVRTEYLSIFDDTRRQLSFIEKCKPNVIEGYPSSLAIIANSRKRFGHKVQPRLVFSLAEILDKGSRKLISSAFDAELFDYYGSSEFSLMAWECREHNGYHINVDSVIMEFVNNEDAVASGERGEIVCTSLVNQTMPLIRYRIGDVGVPVDEQCSCGTTFPLMKIVEGRCDDFLVTMNGRVISPTIFFPYPFRTFEGITQFRVIQEKRDKLTLQLVIGETFSNDGQFFEKARREIRKLFGEDMQVEFQILEKIPRDPSGKLRKIISKCKVWAN